MKNETPLWLIKFVSLHLWVKCIFLGIEMLQFLQTLLICSYIPPRLFAILYREGDGRLLPSSTVFDIIHSSISWPPHAELVLRNSKGQSCFIMSKILPTSWKHCSSPEVLPVQTSLYILCQVTRMQRWVPCFPFGWWAFAVQLILLNCWNLLEIKLQSLYEWLYIWAFVMDQCKIANIRDQYLTHNS